MGRRIPKHLSCSLDLSVKNSSKSMLNQWVFNMGRVLDIRVRRIEITTT
jgi:hypothetical protein